MKPSPRKPKELGNNYAYSVLYDSRDHFSVLTQLWGSVWPRVLPYCIFNVMIMVGLRLLKTYGDWESVAISNIGHNFISMVVAFVLISRVQMSLDRFNTSRTDLASMYRETRELISNMVVHTSNKQNLTPAAREWRLLVSYRTLLLLRTVMAVMDYPSDFVPAWDVPELQGVEKHDILQNIHVTSSQRRKRAHESRSEFEESMRVPIRLSYLLKKAIVQHSEKLTVPLAISYENKLMASVDGFMTGYYGIRKFLTTPVPFPLVQMARTFVFAYVFTVPFVFVGDATSGIVAHCVEVFILTFGFVGLEMVAIELDDPYGDDENDFDNLALAYTCMEDTYLTIQDIDGPEAADRLKHKMKHSSSNPGADILWSPNNHDSASTLSTEGTRLLFADNV